MNALLFATELKKTKRSVNENTNERCTLCTHSGYMKNLLHDLLYKNHNFRCLFIFGINVKIRTLYNVMVF